MFNRLRYILLTILLIAASQAAGQYIIDSVCVDAVRYYRVDGETGSTYIWKMTDPFSNVTTLTGNADTVAITWNVVPGIYKLSTIQHSVVTGCDGLLEIGDIKVFSKPLAFAGNPMTFCSPGPIMLSEATASNYSQLKWTTSGTGTFNNDLILNPVYTASPGDLLTGNVTLTLTAHGLGRGTSCTPAVASVILTHPSSILVSAGPDDVSCLGNNYQFVGAISSNYSNLIWTHNGTGTLQDPTLLNPVYLPGINETGTITFILKAYELPPCIDSATDQMALTIYPRPTATLALAGEDTLCGGDTTSLRIDFTGTPPWSVTISDGFTTHTYTNIFSTPFYASVIPFATCIYTITGVTDLHCPALPSGIHGIVPIMVNPRPGAEFTWHNGLQNNEIQFHIDSTVVNTPAVGNMVQWNFGDGTFGYGYNPLHLYMASNTYVVTLIVTDTTGCSSTVTHLVYVAETPMAFYSSTSPSCLGAPTCFTDLSTVPSPPFGYIVKWVWNFGDGSPEVVVNFPNNPNLCHTYSAIGAYPAKLTITTNQGYVHSYTHDQLVIPVPIAGFTSSMACQSQTVTFTNTSDPNNGGTTISFKWNFGDPASGIDNTSLLPNPTHQFATGNTTYYVTLIISNMNNCTDTIIQPVFVFPAPPVDFVHDSACLAETVHFNANTGITNLDSIATWAWNFGDGSSIVTDPVTTAHAYVTTGTFITTLTVMDHHGCTNVISHEVKVNPLPIPAFSWNTPVCSGNAVQFTDASTVPSGYTGYIAKWEWDFGDGSPLQTVTLPSSPNVQHIFASTGVTYNVKLKVWSSDSCTEEITHAIILMAAPVANFSTSPVSCENQPVQFTDVSSTNGGGIIVGRSWNFDDVLSGSNNSSTLPNPVHTFLTAGNYNVMLIVTNANGCNDTVIKPVTINLSPIASFTADTACFNHPTTFTNTSIANGTSIINYAWDFGDGTFSTFQSPTHTYGSYGVFNVTLQITNSNGCIKSISQQVLVNPLPVAAFSFSTASCLGTPVQYTDMSTTVPGYLGSISRWIWDFGDGTILNILSPASPNVTHIFAGTAGTHTVRLTVITSDRCQNYIEHTVTSTPSPIANFSVPPGNCKSLSVNFTDLSQQNGGGNIISWSWNFGDPVSGTNNFSSTQNPVHQFSAPGVYPVTLIVFNVSNCSDTLMTQVTIATIPVANFTADTACLTAPTTFTNQSGIAVTQWLWDFGDGGTSISSNPTHLYLTAGIFNVHLTVTTTEGCSNEITKQVLVIKKPVSAFAASAPTCIGDSVHFTDLSSTSQGSIVTWSWDFGDGNTAVRVFPQSPNVSHLYTAGGTYPVKLTITTSDNCTDIKISPVMIQSAPIANFMFQNIRCEDKPVQFNDLTQTNGGSPIAQWFWNFGDPGSGTGNTSQLKDPVHTFSTSGSFAVVLYSTTSSGCTDSVVKTVVVSAAPVAQFTANTACAASETQFTDGSTTPTGTNIAWVWNFGEPGSGINNTSTLQNPDHRYATAGNFMVTLTVTNSNGCSNDTIIPVTVYPKPTAMFQYTSSCVNTATQFTDLSLAPNSTITGWFWDFGDGIGTSTIQNPTYTYAASGTYNVKLRITSISNCQDSLTLTVVSMPTPAAHFNYTSFFCPQGQVDFQDASTGFGAPIAERLWIFEPGFGSTVANPTYTFSATNTTFPVTLILTDMNGCRDTITDSVFVKPAFSFSFTNDTVCFGVPTHFTAINMAPGDSLYNLVWNFGDPASGTNNVSYTYNAIHTFTQPGPHTVKLSAVNSNNCHDTVYKDVAVHSLPVPSFTYFYTPDNSMVRFDDASAPGSGTIATWEWDFGDGSPIHTITAPGPGNSEHPYAVGIYQVVLKVTNSFGCSETFTRSVELDQYIIADFTYQDTLNCARFPVVFSDNSNPSSRISQWRWLFGDGQDTTYSIKAGKLVHVYENAGIYQVKLIVIALISGSSFTDTMEQAITIRQTPRTVFSSTDVCANKITLFNDNSENYGVPLVSWNWDFGHPGSGTSNTSTLRDPSHRYDSAGNYRAELLIMNQFGCKDSLIKTVRVHALPAAGFQSSLACSSNPVYFTDKTIPGDTTLQSWRWNFGDPNTRKDTALVQNPKYEYKDGGDYLVRMIVKDKNGCYDTINSTVPVLVSPISAFSITNNVNGTIGKIMLDNQSIGADFYYWDFGNGVNSTDENPIVIYSEDGSYLIKLISYNKNECSDTTFYKYEFLFKGLYIPNAFAPTSNNYEVMFFKPVGINLKSYNIEVFDSWGHRVWNSRALDSQGKPSEKWDGKDADGNLMPSGTYMWKANAQFIDGTEWQGSDIGKGAFNTMGTVTLIR